MSIEILKLVLEDTKKIFEIDTSSKIFERYEQNNKGYRGSNFLKNVNFVAMGCSQSFGIGVPIEGTWPGILAKKNNYTYNNLSIPGGSMMQLIYNFFNYVDEFGTPEYLLCLFPDFYRMRYGWDREVLNLKYNQISNGKKNGISSMDTSFGKNYESKKYLKLPANPEDVFPEIHFYYINILFINLLEIYCKISNIKLIWATIDELYSEELKKQYKNYFAMKDIDNEFSGVGKQSWKNKLCHEEFKNNFINCFDIGFDANEEYHNQQINPGHMGVHCHIHYAEAFDKKIKNYLDKNV